MGRRNAGPRTAGMQFTFEQSLSAKRAGLGASKFRIAKEMWGVTTEIQKESNV